jgi:hypothetical protein
MSDAVQLVLSAVVGGLAGTFATAYKSRKELESLYDIELRRKRMDAYAELWKLLEPLAYWAPQSPLTYAKLASVSRTLRKWYFVSGGLVLSKRTRAPYFNLQQALTELSAGDRATSEKRLEEDTRDIVKALASRLRTATTDDVASRVVPALGQRFGARLRTIGRRPAPVRVEIDRRWDFKKSPPVPAFFVIVDNVSGHEVEVEDIEVDEGRRVTTVEHDGEEEELELSFLLQPNENREVRAPVEGESVRPGHTPRVTVRLSGHDSVRSTDGPGVPLRTPVLELPERPNA